MDTSDAIMVLTAAPAMAYREYRTVRTASSPGIAKLFAAYTAFELRARVQRQAKKMISAGLSTANPGWQGKVFTDLEAAWQTQLDAAFPRPLPPLPLTSERFVPSREI